MEAAILVRLAACERNNRRITTMLLVAALSSLLALAAAIWAVVRISRPAAAVIGGSLRLSELVIVDPSGRARVRLGGQLPDDVRNGRPVPRGEQAAGLLLYDSAGRERGGYVTFAPSGNVVLTLDDRERQVAFFVAGPEGGSALRLWQGRNWVELRADGDGARLNAIRDGRVILQEPAIAEPENSFTCTELRQLESQHPRAALLEACAERLPGTSCRKCLGPG